MQGAVLMARYLKKAILVEAEQWFPGVEIEGVFTLSKAIVPYIDSKRGPLTVEPGDWIVTEPGGKVYPCKPERFAEDFEEQN